MNAGSQNILTILENHQLRKTSIRKQVLQVFLDAEGRALANSDLEKALDNPDRITLYRTLKAFEEKGLIHQAIDGDPVIKYALCSEACTVHQHHDQHAHFHCQECGKTLCLEEVANALPPMPEGYRVVEVHLLIKGICRECS